MKKRGIFVGILIALLILNISFIIAAENATDQKSKIDKAYDCLELKVKDRCSSLSTEEKVFSLLAIRECKDEVLSDSKYMTDSKSTAQAILALNKVGADTSYAEEWLISQNATPSNLEWLLQIESKEATTCTISYSGSSYSDINVGENKKITGGSLGPCLSVYEEYWLKINPSCYDQEIEILCTDDFSTNLLYKKQGSDTLYVSSVTSHSSAGGTTTEKVNSFCFSSGTSCNYEASLWAALVLDLKEYDVSGYIPYLVAMSDEPENQKYLPEAFLYPLTNNFRTELLLKQKSNQWWLESGDKFYDTALALFSFSNEEPTEKTNSINWLLGDGVQDSEGCWQGNIRNTAFLLASIWPTSSFTIVDDDPNCEDAGYFCMSQMKCSTVGGDILKGYDCFGIVDICCNKNKELETCSEQGGEICSSGETCTGTTTESSDAGYGDCCVGGECKVQVEESECESYDGECRTSCYSDEEEAEYDCSSGEVCCIEKTVSEKKSYLWVWLLLILITLVVLGIIFKDKLRPVWFKIKSKFDKFTSKGKKSGPGNPPRGRPGMPTGRMAPRKILPPTQRSSLRRPPMARPKGEMDDVLKRLKEMGK
ncbi:hypothetical protein KAJ87_02710 [Candidatus Pacearchaeota archaeon]|nr:hypothetical protein [Candidatus Pacearchaeota archaeon]